MAGSGQTCSQASPLMPCPEDKRSAVQVGMFPSLGRLRQALWFRALRTHSVFSVWEKIPLTPPEDVLTEPRLVPLLQSDSLGLHTNVQHVGSSHVHAEHMLSIRQGGCVSQAIGGKGHVSALALGLATLPVLYFRP